MINHSKRNDVQVLAKFSAVKVWGMCGIGIAAAVFAWSQIPGMADYQGSRFSPETARFLLLSATVIFTAFLPLWAWHIWNFLTRPGALYVSDGRLFIYWAYFQSIPIKGITDAVHLGRASRLGDRVCLSVTGQKNVKFQTTFMEGGGEEVVAAIKEIAAVPG